ncbi:MAG: hypothetical protein K2M97_04890, partial [Muribaculaceae bacterium]|nr:hypothetical protein [Muribaculaceae bacterium]
MINRLFAYILTFVVLTASFSCQDDFPMQRAPLTDGESDVSFTVSFKDFTPALDSRSDGKAMRSIRSLWVAVYKADGTFVKLSEITDYSTSTEVNKRPDGSITTESYTGRASFTMRLHNGQYHIYAIANTD